LLAQRGVEVSYEAIRCWTIKFGRQIAADLSARRRAPSPRWHLEEMVCSIAGKRWFLWRAVYDEGVVLDVEMQCGKAIAAELRLLGKLLRNQPVEPESIVSDGLRSYKLALTELGL
jgi:transposase-like protein